MIRFQRLEFNEGEILGGLIDENLIGNGGSGKVYRVTTTQGQILAVKTIRHQPRQGGHKLEKQFLAEVHILGRIRHCNIVNLLCYITGNNTKLLVYEYMENHCLYKLLHGKKKAGLTVVESVLGWERRLKIAIGAAQGRGSNICITIAVHPLFIVISNPATYFSTPISMLRLQTSDWQRCQRANQIQKQPPPSWELLFTLPQNIAAHEK